MFDYVGSFEHYDHLWFLLRSYYWPRPPSSAKYLLDDSIFAMSPALNMFSGNSEKNRRLAIAAAVAGLFVGDGYQDSYCYRHLLRK